VLRWFGALVPRVPAAVALVVVDVVAVADGYSFQQASRPDNLQLDEREDRRARRSDHRQGSRVVRNHTGWPAFWASAAHLVAVPYASLQISQEGQHIVLPGATKEQLKAIPEFVYR